MPAYRAYSMKGNVGCLSLQVISHAGHMKFYYLYILSSRHHRYLSIGVTGDLGRGVQRHRERVNRMRKRRRVWQKLVYVEAISDLEEAVDRELELRRLNRAGLVQLVESVNPGWDSISLSELCRSGFSSSGPVARL